MPRTAPPLRQSNRCRSFLLLLGWVWALLCSTLSAQPLTACNSPNLPINSTLPPTTDLIVNVNSFLVANVEVEVDITHTWIGDLEIGISSPLGTNVTLHSNSGGAADNVFVTYSTTGMPNAPPYSCGGCLMQPEPDAAALTNFSGEEAQGGWLVRVEDSVAGDNGSLNQWCMTLSDVPPAIRVSDLICLDTGGAVDLCWNNNGPYDSINVYAAGQIIDSLAGDETCYSATGLSPGGIVEVSVEPVLGASVGALTCCSVTLLAAADAQVCSYPKDPISDLLPPATDTLFMTDDFSLADLQVTLQLTHTWIGDLEVSVSSPAATSVTLHDNFGGNSDDMFVVYWTEGVANASVPFACDGCAMQPGPNPSALVSFLGESSQGSWSIAVADLAPGDEGTLVAWCVRAFESGPDYPASGLTCATAPGSGVIDANWNNNGDYASIGVFLDGTEIAVIPGSATSYSAGPLPLPAPDSMLCVEPRLTSGSLPQTCCDIDLNLAAPQNLQCAVFGNDASLQWDNPSGYDSIQVFADGVLQATLSGSTSSYLVMSLTSGDHELQIRGVVGSNFTMLVGCDVLILGVGLDDLIWIPPDTNSGGIDDGFAIAASLGAAGRGYDFVTALPPDLSGYDRVWVLLGTFPDEHDLSQGEGGLLRNYCVNLGGHVYLSGGDTWGDPSSGLTPFDEVDGVDGSRVDDGFPGCPGTSWQISGIDSGLGLDLSSFNAVDVDTVECNWIDQLVFDEGAPIWQGSYIGGTLFVGGAMVGLQSDLAPGNYRVITSSVEFGALEEPQRDAILASYLEFLDGSGSATPNFVRGDVNGDSTVVALIDALYFLNFGFNGGPEPPCMVQADINNDNNVVALTDSLYLLNFGFNGGTPPPFPGTSCGSAVEDVLLLGCANPACP